MHSLTTKSEKKACAIEILLSDADEHCDKLGVEEIMDKLSNVGSNCSQWQHRIENEYSFKHACAIFDLQIHLLNKSNGFADRNDNSIYYNIISKDESGIWIKEATLGFKLRKKNYVASKLFPYFNDRNPEFQKLRKKKNYLVSWPRILDCDVDSEDMDLLLLVKVHPLLKAINEKKKKEQKNLI